MINRFVAVGRLTRNPELKDHGFKQTNFTIAIDRNYESKDGQKADYIPCVANNKLAENIAKYCKKHKITRSFGRLYRLQHLPHS